MHVLKNRPVLKGTRDTFGITSASKGRPPLASLPFGRAECLTSGHVGTGCRLACKRQQAYSLKIQAYGSVGDIEYRTELGPMRLLSPGGTEAGTDLRSLP